MMNDQEGLKIKGSGLGSLNKLKKQSGGNFLRKFYSVSFIKTSCFVDLLLVLTVDRLALHFRLAGSVNGFQRGMSVLIIFCCWNHN